MFVLAAVAEGMRHAVDRNARHLVATAFGVALLPLVSVVWTTVSQGIGRLDLTFSTYSMRNVSRGRRRHRPRPHRHAVGDGDRDADLGPDRAADRHLPRRVRTRLARPRHHLLRVDVMTGIPSIVAGLFAYALMALIVGPGFYSGLSGAIALSVLMIPVVVRSTEELLRIVPNELREASYALGVPKWRTILKVVLPTALSGIVSGVILAIARVVGETAPVMVAAGFTDSLNNNPLSGPMMTMSNFVYAQYRYPGVPPEPYVDRAWAGALTLILLVMLLNLIGRLVAARFAPKRSA